MPRRWAVPREARRAAARPPTRGAGTPARSSRSGTSGPWWGTRPGAAAAGVSQVSSGPGGLAGPPGTSSGCRGASVSRAAGYGYAGTGAVRLSRAGSCRSPVPYGLYVSYTSYGPYSPYAL